MMTLSQFTRFPAAFKNREKLVDQVELTNVNYEVNPEENTILIKSSTKSGYRQELKIFDNKISLKSPCKVHCDCESFKYEFAHAIYRHDSLLHPFSLFRSVLQRPKHRNQFDIPSPCKHLVKLAREALKIKIK